MKHIILGHASDPHAQHILAQLHHRGHEAYLFETHKFPSEAKISLTPADGGGTLTLPDGNSAAFSDIASVYWRNFCGVSAETTKANRGTIEDISYYDSMASLRSWFQARNQTHWLNSWEAYQSHQEKPQQLQLVAQAGVRIPRTYIGNDPQQVLAFCKAEPHAIFKPVYGGAHTERITEQHLAGAHLAKALTQAPITLQQYVDGTNIRTYAIGEQLFSLELETDDVDFRTDQKVNIKKIELPEAIRLQVPAIMEQLSLNWTAIDWRRDTEGQYYFLEANPSPMFMGIEHSTGYPITDTLIDAMINGHSRLKRAA
ncbi:MvdC/MvdD family ATP grasp protein [Janthinobacterium fluminis]|uniref:ATP-grasp domain-containing protein n=1 Tax=Janthinobacterium fluminis TaxID=2987524 RepID=A0ABT5JVM8_9BURK|nr:hypothetical protein [Janthinobacterium fluminis]MDC8756785.1 hypothetical protein [Janthinobacterium fluminis]